ncbi:E2/UBC family protein [Billgrantia sp. LNSP4103-1]|uniref:E2/UBC family protein n=1 Tax=Billgrantia sp. LNSP4103-1 TaxID=3410266 RepID=UPI00403F6022
MVIPQLLKSLEPMGFRRLLRQTTPGYLHLEGALNTRFGAVPCDVYVDRELRSFPNVLLKSPLPPSLLPIAPHVGPSGLLCYVSSSTAVFDIYKPVTQTIAALRRAEEVLDRVMANDLVNDLQEEFYAYWHGACCYTDIESVNSTEIIALVLGEGGENGLAFSDNAERTKAKLGHLFSDISESVGLSAKITTKAPPRPLIDAWPPKTVKALLDWQAALDPNCRRKILKRIAQGYRRGANVYAVVLDTPVGQIGALIHDLQKHPRKKKIDQSMPIFDAPIILAPVARLDDRYIVSRNIPGQETLSGKRILLIGCGTIGGYLADMLVKAGGGCDGGELLLVDNQWLAAGNIGRHRLGVNRLNINKAEGLVEEIKMGMPSSRVIALPVDAYSLDLNGFHLVIDATGEQPFSQWIAGQQALGRMGGQRGKEFTTPLLHVWIEGSGEAVRSHIRKQPVEGCYRCLCDYEAEGHFLSVLGGVDPVLAGGGCEGQYVAYPASVSVQAAALGLDTALAWANQRPWPSLSTRVISREHDSSAGDVTILPKLGCPACAS